MYVGTYSQFLHYTILSMLSDGIFLLLAIEVMNEQKAAGIMPNHIE